MKILFLTSRFPYPLEKGDKLRAYYQIRELSKYNDIYLISITDNDPRKEDLEKLRVITKSIYLIRIQPGERYISLFSNLMTRIPFQVAWFYSKKINTIIQKIADDIQPDHCFCQLTRMAEYCRNFTYPKTLDYMDSFGVGMKRRATLVKGIAKLIYNIEASRMIQYEALISNNFDNLIIISEQDKDQFNFAKSKDIIVINNGIDPSFFEFSSTAVKDIDIVFVGNMGYLPNIESAEYIVNKIMPLCPEDIKILIAGTSPDGRVKKLGSKKVEISGWLEDIRYAYGRSRIFVAPLWSGTGQQNKILEAMAMGLPCITTTLVNNAIGAKTGTEILIADNAEQFSEKILTLLSNQHFYDQISQNAKIFVKQKFDWKQNGLILSSTFAQN